MMPNLPDETVMATLPADWQDRENQEIRKWAIAAAISAGVTGTASVVRSASLIYDYVKGETA